MKTTKFFVWRQDHERDEDGGEVGAMDIRYAAEARAEHDNAYRDGWEWSWPVVYLVEDDQGSVWAVHVDRRAIPEFEAARPILRPDLSKRKP